MIRVSGDDDDDDDDDYCDDDGDNGGLTPHETVSSDNYAADDVSVRLC